MLLAIDVGNSHIVVGIFNGNEIILHKRISTFPQRTSDEFSFLIEGLLTFSKIKVKEVDSAIISTVVPPLATPLKEMIKSLFKIDPMFVEAGIKTGLDIRYDDPREVGADRIVNAVAGYTKFGGPLIIIDFGTATTFCVISEKGEYLGGAIAQGLGISIEALFTKTAKLPKVEMIKPKRIIGKNTVESIQSGIYYGTVSMIDGMIEKISQTLSKKPTIIATGGYANEISMDSKYIQKVCPFLTLEGLKILYDKNHI